MPRNRIERLGTPPVRGGVTQALSPAVCVEGRLVFCSGQTPPMRDGRPAAPDAYGQTLAVIAQIEAILAEAGCRLEDVVKVTCWLADAADYPEFNRAYIERFGDIRPARSTVLAGMIPPVKLEIEAVALRPESA